MKTYTPENVEFSVNGVKITGFADAEVWKIPVTDKWNVAEYIEGGTNHLQGLNIKVVGEWPMIPKNFNRKENTMQYMTNKMLQRFMSHMTTTLSLIQLARQEIEQDIKNGKWEGNKLLPYHYEERKIFRKDYLKYSILQEHIKRGFIGNSGLQRMEKVVTMWIKNQQDISSWAYEDYLENRYDPFYRNKSKQAKRKLAKLVELQQAIRKQKSITKG